jgi:hypothetical protein
MATVILDVPSEKIKSFVKMILDLGIEKNRIIPDTDEKTISPQKPWYKRFKPHPYFDWEFFSNELEFE